MLTIAAGILLATFGVALLAFAPGLLLRFGAPVLGVLLVFNGHAIVGGVLLAWLALFWSAYVVAVLRIRWQERRRA